MAFRLRADDGPTLNAGLVALCFYGDPDLYCLGILYFCSFPGRGSGLPLDPHMQIPISVENYNCSLLKKQTRIIW